VGQVLASLSAGLFLVLIVWVAVFGLAAAWVADTKDRDAIAWFFLGIILGPFAVLVVGLSASSDSGRGWVRSAGAGGRARPQAAGDAGAKGWLRGVLGRARY